jgi:ribonuclease-3
MLSDSRTKQLQEFAKSLGLAIADFSLLNNALTHSSYIKEKKLKSVNDNEKLEFFGDAILKMLITEYLMSKYVDFSEGKLSKLRSYVVSEKVLSEIAFNIGLKKHLLLGKGEMKLTPVSVLADALEALLAVIYYECGISKTRDFILKYWKQFVEEVSFDVEKGNYKAMLQEYTQANKAGLPEYITVSESGPDHNKLFEVSVLLNKTELGRGKGKTKKDASQLAAKNALKSLQKKG